jgi:hypothetical protein
LRTSGFESRIVLARNCRMMYWEREKRENVADKGKNAKRAIKILPEHKWVLQ